MEKIIKITAMLCTELLSKMEGVHTAVFASASNGNKPRNSTAACERTVSASRRSDRIGSDHVVSHSWRRSLPLRTSNQVKVIKLDKIM